MEECEGNLHDADSIIKVKDEKLIWYQKQLALKNASITEYLVIIDEQGATIERGEKREKRTKVKNGLIKGGIGGGAAILLGLYLWKEFSD